MSYAVIFHIQSAKTKQQRMPATQLRAELLGVSSETLVDDLEEYLFACREFSLFLSWKTQQLLTPASVALDNTSTKNVPCG
jgi:hypothetical protein